MDCGARDSMGYMVVFIRQYNRIKIKIKKKKRRLGFHFEGGVNKSMQKEDVWVIKKQGSFSRSFVLSEW